MVLVLGLAESSWVSICLVILPLGIGAFVRYKAKADKSELMIDVVKKIDEEIAPIQKRMNKHDDDFKEFKRYEIEPMKKDINELITKLSVIDTKVDNTLTGIDRIEDSLKNVLGKLDQKKDK